MHTLHPLLIQVCKTRLGKIVNRQFKREFYKPIKHIHNSSTTNLRWSDVPIWILYPVGYCIYIFVRGELTGLYPYYFIDVSVLGYFPAILNAVAIGFGFVLVATLLIAIIKLKNKSEQAV